MSWREALTPVRMERVALVAPEAAIDPMLTEIAASGAVELDLPRHAEGAPDEFARARDAAVLRDGLAGYVGWTPSTSLPDLAERLAPAGAAAVPIQRPRGVEPPTLLSGEAEAAGMSRALVDTYGTVPYRDIDPARAAAFAYIVMFGMMFGDVGHGAILLGIGLLLRTGRPRRFAGIQRAWGFVTAAGAAAIAFGFLYGEAFGPTGLVPVLWLSPLEEPVPFLIAAIVLGSVLLAAAYAIGTVNRVREGGWGYALYARSGVAGSLLFLAAAVLAGGIVWGLMWLVALAAALAVLAIVFLSIGLYVASGGHFAGVLQTVIEVGDTIIRLGSNVVSFARLAAFGLTHAALLLVVWQGTTALWGLGPLGAVAGVLLFVVGNVLTFALEALVAAIQALRLSYYELFSRVFESEGRPFRPWSPAVDSAAGPTPYADEGGVAAGDLPVPERRPA
ncbi:V-type ATPase 116kDa subunit family protein [Microbacterium thalassium]|uniref:V/A-type H+-transporting ATPase subunit I n=1 Tax=Microbacterium thalassium TaxID=362649 RepID=A0A7X0FR32_9MICO|nr:V-type ATPase 116kDa subunit family protein [Microbacterium thalassium]MBB6392061.1 V/A-type H+-transporting ATPase subunit I [Microbacterium thalassium]GLK24980.1 hypothetical protein GCM10017607_22980 [Microbacterium thalassium]